MVSATVAAAPATRAVRASSSRTRHSVPPAARAAASMSVCDREEEGGGERGGARGAGERLLSMDHRARSSLSSAQRRPLFPGSPLSHQQALARDRLQVLRHGCGTCEKRASERRCVKRKPTTRPHSSSLLLCLDERGAREPPPSPAPPTHRCGSLRGACEAGDARGAAVRPRSKTACAGWWRPPLAARSRAEASGRAHSSSRGGGREGRGGEREAEAAPSGRPSRRPTSPSTRPPSPFFRRPRPPLST